ncbi:MAG: hypothetical protein M3436_03155 [Pseudomonadota bacterium]|nr:hypothetical protein [Pseudomonadota bacterium]
MTVTVAMYSMVAGNSVRADTAMQVHFAELITQHPVHFTLGLQKQLSSRSPQQAPHLRWFEVQQWEFTCGMYQICRLQRKVVDCMHNSLNTVEYQNSVEAGDMVIENYVPRKGVLRFRFREKPLGEEWVAAHVVLEGSRYVKDVKAEVTEWGRVDPKKQLGVYEFISDRGTFERSIPCKVSWPGMVDGR